MDRLNRMPGPANAQSTSLRGLPENPAQGRRPVPNSAATSNGPPPPLPPLPNLRNASSNATLSASNSMSSQQVIALAREAMRSALESEKGQAAEAGAVGAPGLRSGVTIDLSRKNINKLPEEVVDIVKDELERLALSHNQISSLPARFSECTSLRYLNIRGNQIKEFPLPLCGLKSLEILDLGRNQLRVLPPDIVNLSSLKVLSIPKNQIRELPLCLADMTSLQVVKLEGNPISFPPKDAIQPQSGSPPNDGGSRDTEVTEVAVTALIKKFLRQYAMNGRMEAEATGDESSEGAETPRFPLKRAASGRFPIKINGSDVSDMRSPNATTRPPPIPSRSHYRGLSQQSTSIRRPSVMPLTIGNVNERLRSNSESLLRSDRSDGRNRRMGVVTRKTSELGTLDETQANVRFSHYRGLSHGSAMQGTPSAAKSPGTPTEPHMQHPTYIRRLSVLPERRRESKIFDPVIEAAKGILYSVFQIHPMIQALMTLTNDGSAKRSSLEIVVYNTNSHVLELEEEVQKHDAAVAEGDEYATRENEHVLRACQTLVGAYGHVCTLLADNIDTFVDNGDARYVRTLLLCLYNSIMELRVTLASVTAEQARSSQPTRQDVDSANSHTIRPYHREPTATPTAERPGFARHRNGTVVHNPANLRVATNVPVPHHNGGGRTAIMTSATPRSGESFPSIHSRGISIDSSEDDAHFDRIYLSLQKSIDIVLRTLPNFHVQLAGGLRHAIAHRAPATALGQWKALIATVNTTIQQTEILRNKLSLVKLKDPTVRTQLSFWRQCFEFVDAWMALVYLLHVKDVANAIPLPPDTRARLRPVQQTAAAQPQQQQQQQQHQPPPSLSTSPRLTTATTATSTATAMSTSRSTSPPTSLSQHALQQHHQQQQQQHQQQHHPQQHQQHHQQHQQHPSPPLAPLHPHLPSPSSERHVAEARAAVVASIGNMLDAQLQTRASVLHDNAAALDRQERDVVAATDALRRERERLAREADAAARRVKELGNVQNWAEVLERGFLVLEETVRLANRGPGSDSGRSGSGSGSCSCSCSDCGKEDDDDAQGEEASGRGDVDVDMDMDGVQGEPHGKDAETDAMAVDVDGTRSAWSDTSRSLMEPESSTGTGRAKGSDTASLSTGSSSKDVT
ncbi:cell morphogenesis protein Sog2 [Purpureocillium lavendulum]|uniref:Cell morphogenesis protein Sog2 n=1 Tax=Purpureocillium lavendulum TaxID=1247861 RepID=A0AB34FJP2_9HYPO|nr:cell morphogenesis protein Sog2 [Purpureocillium lavendulum]